MPALGSKRQRKVCEFEVSLVCRGSSRIARTVKQRSPTSIKKKIACVCVYVHVSGHINAGSSVYACGNRSSTLGVFLNCFSALIFTEAGYWLSPQSQPTPSSGVTGTHSFACLFMFVNWAISLFRSPIRCRVFLPLCFHLECSQVMLVKWSL